MNVRDQIRHGYAINVRRVEDRHLFRVCYVPRGAQHARTQGRVRKSPEYVAIVNVPAETVTWENPPVDPEVEPNDFDGDAIGRSKIADDWLLQLRKLMNSVETWAKELGWSTKIIEKPMEESEIGKYLAPALLMQEDTTKVLLEPIARLAPGAEGVVDLYLMPGYDDIASLFYHGRRWNLHYLTPDEKEAAFSRETEERPLTKSSLKKVLEEMKSHAQ